MFSLTFVGILEVKWQSNRPSITVKATNLKLQKFKSKIVGFMLFLLNLSTLERLDLLKYMYRTTCFCTHIHNINHSISIYLMKVILFGHIHDHLGEKHIDS